MSEHMTKATLVARILKTIECKPTEYRHSDNMSVRELTAVYRYIKAHQTSRQLRAKQQGCDHKWYMSDGKFQGSDFTKAQETCEKCGAQRWVKVEKYKG